MREYLGFPCPPDLVAKQVEDKTKKSAKIMRAAGISGVWRRYEDRWLLFPTSQPYLHWFDGRIFGSLRSQRDYRHHYVVMGRV